MPTLTKIERIQTSVVLFAHGLEPEELRGDHIAGNHDPIGPRIVSEGAIDERKTLVGIRAIPGDEELHRVGVAHDGARRQGDLAHAVDVILRDEILERRRRAAAA
jgi:hypothetical protein